MLASSADFVENDPDQALGFVMADRGYDVWLANLRGNFYSRNHTYLSPDQREFWEHTWTDMGRYDVTAMLKYVRRVSGAGKVRYLGHSLGTSLFFIACHFEPDITSWVSGMAALAPVAFIYHRHVPLGLVSPFVDLLQQILIKSENYELQRLDPPKQTFTANLLCSASSITSVLCILLHQMLFGLNRNFVDKEYLPVIMSHSPAGTSYQVVLHLLQLHASRRFQMYDYGVTRNLREYGQSNPPLFSLSSVKCPIGIFWSQNDWLADFRDVAQTASELPWVVVNQKVAEEEYNHMDFLWAENAYEIVYKSVIEFLDIDHRAG